MQFHVGNSNHSAVPEWSLATPYPAPPCNMILIAIIVQRFNCILNLSRECKGMQSKVHKNYQIDTK